MSKLVFNPDQKFNARRLVSPFVYPTEHRNTEQLHFFRSQ